MFSFVGLYLWIIYFIIFNTVKYYERENGMNLT